MTITLAQAIALLLAGIAIPFAINASYLARKGNWREAYYSLMVANVAGTIALIIVALVRP